MNDFLLNSLQLNMGAGLFSQKQNFGAPPPPPGDKAFITTESGDIITTESGDLLTTEGT